MTPSTFRKTLLTLAITGSALSAQAQTIEQLKPYLNISNNNYWALDYAVKGGHQGEFSIDWDRELSGVVTARDTVFSQNLNFDTNIDVRGNGIAGIELWDSKVGGDLTIEGAISVKGDTVSEEYEDTYQVWNPDTQKFETVTVMDVDTWGVSGVVAEGDEIYATDQFGNTLWGSVVGYTSAVGGTIRNKASITAEGQLAIGMLISEHEIGGDVINEGSISVKGETYLDEGSDASGSWRHAVGVTALVIEDSSLAGDVRNSGTIRAESTNATGLSLDWMTLEGKLINDGSIEVQGDSVDSIEEDETYREIAAAVTLDEVELLQIRNGEKGRIVATGKGSVGLDISYTAFGDTGEEAHIVNSGLIQGEHAAIHIGEQVEATALHQVEIWNKGAIVSQRAAIEVESGAANAWYSPMPVKLLWEQGTISGDLLGLSNIDVFGNATFKREGKTGVARIKLAQGGVLAVGVRDEIGVVSYPGHLELGQAHTELDGSLKVAGDSSLGMTLSTATQQEQPLLAVTGNAEFEAGSQIKLAAKGSDFKAEGSQYTLVEAGTLANNGVTVTSSSTLLKVDTFKAEGNSLVATVTGKGQAEIQDIITQPGDKADQSAVNAAKAAESFIAVLGDANLPANDPVAQILTGGTLEQQQQVIRQLAPEVSGAASQAAVSGQSMVSNVASGRTGGARGMSSGGAFGQTGVWVQALNSDATQDLRDGVAGFDASTTGIAVGLDGKLNDQLTLGLAYSFLDTDVDAEGGNRTEVQGHNFTLYSGFVQNGFFVDGSLTYGQNANEGERRIASTLAKADYDSTLLGVNLTAGYTYPLQGTVVVEPQVTARYSNVEIDEIEETGSSAALNTKKQRYEVGELGAGVQLVGRIDLERGSISPRIKLMAYHDLIADQAQSTSSFVLGGTPFVTTGAKPERNSYEAGLGADYRLGALTLGVSYDYFGKSDYSSDTFSAKLRYDF